MAIINLSDDQNIELQNMESHELISMTVNQWGNYSTTIYMTYEEALYISEFLLNYVESSK